MREDVKKTQTKPTAKPTAREVLWPLIEAMPLGKRGEPILTELRCYLAGKHNTGVHEFILPDYCYNIFEKLGRTVFQTFPTFSELAFCPDPSKLAQVKTYEEAKQVMQLDWYRLGKLFGIPVRLARYFDLEMEDQLEQDGLGELDASQMKDVVTMLGASWLEKMGVSLADLTAGNLSPTLNKTFTGNGLGQNLQQAWSQVAFQWGPDAMSEFNRGIADGIKEFMDETGQLAGESTRTGNYAFMLILWPEIKEMLEWEPLPDRTEVFQWVTQFHDVGLVSFPDVDNFRDFCESIGLKFAGRPPKKS
jgi:hypothetical protein